MTLNEYKAILKNKEVLRDKLLAIRTDVVEIQNVYNFVNIPLSLLVMFLFADETITFEDETVATFISLDKIKDPLATLNIDFITMDLMPIAFFGEKSILVYNLKDRMYYMYDVTTNKKKSGLNQHAINILSISKNINLTKRDILGDRVYRRNSGIGRGTRGGFGNQNRPGPGIGRNRI